MSDSIGSPYFYRKIKMAKNKGFYPSLFIITLLVAQMITPSIVFADEGTPPPAKEETPVVETASDTMVSTPTTSSSQQEEISVTEAAVTEEPANSNSEVVVEESLQENVTFAEALEMAPEGTDGVVVNEKGELEPLVTEEAAQIVAEADPIWCPAGQLPGDAGCTASHTSVTNLVNELVGNTAKFNGAGTIYFTPTYSTPDATLDGGTLTALTDLIVQGGWNGTSGAGYALNGVTTFSTGLTVTSWNGNVTLKNITVDDGAGYTPPSGVH